MEAGFNASTIGYLSFILYHYMSLQNMLSGYSRSPGSAHHLRFLRPPPIMLDRRIRPLFLSIMAEGGSEHLSKIAIYLKLDGPAYMLGGYLHLQGEPRQTPSRRSSQRRESPHRPTPIGPETPKGGCSYRGSYVQSQRVRGVHKKHLAAWDRGKVKAGRLMRCWSGPAKDKTREGPPEGEKDPFPILGTLYAERGLVRIGLKYSKSTVPHQ